MFGGPPVLSVTLDRDDVAAPSERDVGEDQRGQNGDASAWLLVVMAGEATGHLPNGMSSVGQQLGETYYGP